MKIYKVFVKMVYHPVTKQRFPVFDSSKPGVMQYGRIESI